MLRKVFIISFASILLFMLLLWLHEAATAGHAVLHEDDPPICGSYTEVLDNLFINYQEKIVNHGVARDGSLVLILVNAEKHTWSEVVIYEEKPQRVCLTRSGKNWRSNHPTY